MISEKGTAGRREGEAGTLGACSKQHLTVKTV